MAGGQRGRLGRVLTSFGQTAGLVVLAAVTLVLCYLAVKHTSDATPPDGPTTTSQDSTSSNTPSGSPSPSTSSSSSAQPTRPPPKVADRVSADFSAGDALPTTARVYDNESVDQGMTLSNGTLTDGPPSGPNAISSLEDKLPADVAKLSAQMTFPSATSGSVVLVAWKGSLIDARQADNPVPQSGLRLVVAPGTWQLTAYDKKPDVLASGTWSAGTKPVTFTVFRSKDTAWVVPPAGKTAQVSDPRIQQFAGPWACWQLMEDKAGQQPAEIDAVSAG